MFGDNVFDEIDFDVDGKVMVNYILMNDYFFGNIGEDIFID